MQSSDGVHPSLRLGEQMWMWWGETLCCVMIGRESLWNNCGKTLDIIVGSCLVWYLLATNHTAMMDHPSLLPIVIEVERLHESVALRCSVAGSLIIDVLAPQAQGAVVTVTTSLERLHGDTAVLAGKRFLARDEDHG